MKLLIIGLCFAFAKQAVAQDLVPVLDSKTSLYFYSDSTLSIRTSSRMYDYAGSFSEGLAAVRLNGKWGFINAQEVFMVQPVFAEALPFRNGFAAVIDENGRSNFIRHDGSLLCAESFDVTKLFSGNLAIVATNNKWGYVDTSGKIAIPLDFDRASDFSEGLAAIKKDNKWGFIDQNGNTVIPAIYDAVTKFSENMAGVEKEGKVYYINSKGETVLSIPGSRGIQSVNPFCNGKAWVNSVEEWQQIDMNGKVLMKMQCESILPYSEGLSLFRSNGLWGFMDTNGIIVITARFLNAGSFENGFARVYTSTKSHLVDKRGYVYLIK